jgi:dipeptide/tripeptide permease
VIAIVQGGLVGKLAKLLGERRLAMIGAVVVALGLGALPWQPTLTLTVACLLLVACGQGLLQPCLSTLLSRSSAADAQGGVLGLGQSLSSLARVVSPLIAGVLFERGVFLPYALAATLMLGVCWLLSSLPLPAES